VLKVRRGTERFGIYPVNLARILSIGYPGGQSRIRRLQAAQVKRGSGTGFRALQVEQGNSSTKEG